MARSFSAGFPTLRTVLRWGAACCGAMDMRTSMASIRPGKGASAMSFPTMSNTVRPPILPSALAAAPRNKGSGARKRPASSPWASTLFTLGIASTSTFRSGASAVRSARTKGRKRDLSVQPSVIAAKSFKRLV